MADGARAASQARTREAIIAAAHEAFPNAGFHRTSLEQVARGAGVTTGAIYSNFSTKAELFLAVYERQMDRWIADLEAAVSEGGSVADRTAAASDEWLRYARSQEGWFRLNLEFWAHAVDDDELRVRFAEQSFRLRHAIAGMIGRDAAERDIDLPLPADQLAVAVNALGNGLLIDRALRPEAVPDGLYEAVLLQLFKSLG